MSERNHFDCADCDVYSCYRRTAAFPADCPGGGINKDGYMDAYKDDALVSKLINCAAVVDASHNRVQEVIAFAKRLGVKVGIAACIGLIKEAQVFAKMLDDAGIENYCANCKIGSINKADMGITAGRVPPPDEFWGMCNPILQARVLEEQGCGLNVVLGLCVGHDALFSMYSSAPTTTLVVKDRALKHNPAVALTADR